MTTRQDIEQAFKTTFETAWLVSPGVYQTEYTIENVDLAAAAEWTRMSISDARGRQETMASTGNRSFERRGTLVVEIHVQRDEGTRRGNVLSRLIVAAFEAKTIAGAILREATVTHLGEFRQWHKVEVRVPFAYYERK